jgi:hypothetical protein
MQRPRKLASSSSARPPRLVASSPPRAPLLPLPPPSLRSAPCTPEVTGASDAARALPRRLHAAAAAAAAASRAHAAPRRAAACTMSSAGRGGGAGGAGGERRRFDGACHRCGCKGHRSRDCTQAAASGAGMICFLCNQAGHKTSECPRNGARVRCASVAVWSQCAALLQRWRRWRARACAP